MDNLDKILEGILFLSGDGVDRGVLMEKLQVTPKQLDKAIEILKTRYNQDCGINLITYKDKLQLSGNPAYAEEVSVVLNPIRERQLTKATMEVMAIVAYKQPVTRIDVQDIRGTNSDYALQTLLNYKLIEVVGRKDAIGKPLLFGTTDLFLRHFGIDSLDELPDYDEIIKSLEEFQIQNNHLYNEFDIPEDEEQSEDNASDNKQTIDGMNQQASQQSDGIDYSLIEDEETEDFTASESTKVEEDNMQHTDNLGIDYSLLADNTDIEI